MRLSRTQSLIQIKLVNGTIVGYTFTRAEHTLRIRSIIGTWACSGPWGLHARKSVGCVPSKLVYLVRLSIPITLSIWMWMLTMPLVFSILIDSSWDFPLVNARITNVACFRLTLSVTVDPPLSAITISPGNKCSKNPQFSWHPSPPSKPRKYVRL